MEDKYNCTVCAKDTEITKVECPGCPFVCCTTCFQTYLLTKNSDVPNCMSCKINYTFDFVASITPDKFHNKEYRKYRTKFVISREKSLLPETQEDAKRLKEKQKNLEEARLLRDQKKAIADRIRVLMNLNIDVDRVRPSESKEAFRLYVNCPEKECRGYLDKKSLCGICNKKACKKCREKLHEDECNKDILENIKLLTKETKQCPACKIPIYKINGCDQMFCTECKTAFSWNTGKIENRVIHNPHYYEWIRSQNNGVVPRNPLDVPMNNMERVLRFPTLLNTFKRMNKNQKDEDTLTRCFTGIQEIRDFRLVRYSTNPDADENKDLRIKFILNEITEEKFSDTLTKREKAKEKKQQIYLILQTYLDVCTDIFRRILNHDDCLSELDGIRKYTNEKFREISLRFNNGVPKITKSWMLSDKVVKDLYEFSV